MSNVNRCDVKDIQFIKYLEEIKTECQQVVLRVLPPDQFGEDYDAERLYNVFDEIVEKYRSIFLKPFSMDDFEKGLMLAGYLMPTSVQDLNDREALKGDKCICITDLARARCKHSGYNGYCALTDHQNNNSNEQIDNNDPRSTTGR